MSALSSVSLISSSSSSSSSSCLFRCTKQPQSHVRCFKLRASLNETQTITSSSPIIFIKQCAKAAIFLTTAATLSAAAFHARAQTPPALVDQLHSPLSEFLDYNSDAVDSTKKLLQDKLQNGDDAEALTILRRLVAAQPAETQWKFMLARVLAETGDTNGARQVFEEILEADPLSFEALLENALLMDRNGEGEAVIERLERALRVAEDHNKPKESRDVRLLIAQLRFLQKNVEEAMNIYDNLTKEDPADFRPYFCRGMIYSLLDKNAEAREQFAKFRELSHNKFEVEGFLRTPLSRMKLFGTDES